MFAMNDIKKGAALLGTCAILALSGTSAMAETTLERILSEGKITVGIHNRAPWGYKGKDGTVKGFSPTLVREAFKTLGVNEVEFVISEFGALIPGLVAERVDAIASGLYITPKRCKVVAFSDPDLSLKDALLVAKGNPKNIHSFADIAANKDIKIGSSRGSANGKNALAAGVSEDQMLLLANTTSTVSALIAERVDAITFSAATTISIMKDENISGIERAVPFTGLIKENGLEKTGFSGIAFRLADTDLRDAYNKRLAEMKADGTVAKIMAEYNFTKAETASELTQAQICAGES